MKTFKKPFSFYPMFCWTELGAALGHVICSSYLKTPKYSLHRFRFFMFVLE